MAVPKNSVRLIIMKFSFSNPGIVPPSVKRLEKETLKERDERKRRSDGMLAISPIQNVGLAEFLNDLERAGYEIIDASYQPRLDNNKRTFHVVRFVFCQKEHVKISDEFRTRRDTISADLFKICLQAAWRVRAFINPFYGSDGEKVPGQTTISINLEARKPLLNSAGQPMMVWQKDRKGRRMGDCPIPLKPAYYLRLQENTIKFTKETS